MTNWPPNYTSEFERRANLLRGVDNCKELAGSLMAFYKDNPLEWIGDWCVTFDPRKKDLRLMPFVMFERQKDFVLFLMDCFNEKEGGLVEKSRDMGASWICCAFSVWLWLFHDGVAIGWGSRKEEYVDTKGDPKAIFPKMRQLIENLPYWMRPTGYNARTHSPYMKIINPANGSTITGEAGDNIGRGGRTSIYFKDESAWYERPEAIEAALGDNTDVQIDISSVNGSANVFYRRRMAGVEWEREKSIPEGTTKVFIMDWRDHPLKTQKWYDLRRAKADREGLLHLFAQEVDRDYAGAVDRLIIPPAWVKAAIDAHIKLNFEPVGMKVAGQDVADEGKDKNALVARHGVVLTYADDWGDGDAGQAAQRAVPICAELGIQELYYDCIGVGAAFKNSVNTMKENTAGGFPSNLKVLPWDAGAKVINGGDHIIQFDEQSPTNENFFKNLKAQAWWSLRTRFYKTYKAVTENEQHDPEDLISIPSNLPNRHKLEMELSQAQHKYSQDMRVMVDKKPNGATSPNLADSCVMCYFPTKELSIFDVL